ncbi:hypothetical protein CKA32_005405 [Geitlerinema sp. FC II]|nr:hypothetical protein CKA32_005405 [Geitlerinema sp. FC II]
MVNPTPPEPPSSRRVSRDEWIAIFIALGVMGGIGVWALGDRDRTWTLVETAPSDAIASPSEPRQESESETETETPTGEIAFDLGEPETDTPDLETEAESDTEIGRQSDREIASTPASERDPNRDASGDTEGAFPTSSPEPISPETTLETTPEPPTPETPTETATAPPAQVDPNLAEPGTPIGFVDVPEEYWAKPYIDAMSARNLVEGVEENRFAPEEPVTRAQFAALIGRIFEGRTSSSEAIAFNDISGEYWAVEAINEAVRLGFLKGYPGQVFQPEQPVTRFEVLLSLSSGLGLESPENPDAVLGDYTDRDTVPDWAKPAVAAAVNAGLLGAYPDNRELDLDRAATRADVTAIAYRALVQAGEAEAIEPANPQ